MRFIVWCPHPDCPMTRWSDEKKWEVNEERSNLLAGGHEEAFQYCPMHQVTKKTPRYDLG